MSEEKRITKWNKAREITPEKLEIARLVLDDVRAGEDVLRALRRHPLEGGGYLGKHVLVAAYRELVENGGSPPDEALLARIRMKPVRSLSGVTTVTVLTKPYPCVGKCVFCPTDARMPKSYLPDEPGAARAYQSHFDAYDQVESRLTQYEAVGHPIDKIELLILGGTWSNYPHSYQEEFIRRCFEAMNGTEAPDLRTAHQQNENALHRNVGLVIETRPDEITPKELAWLRQLGVTKVQMGAQSLDERVLLLNKRGHTAAQTLHATALLRAAGFKIVLHWMPNLLGATPESDRVDFMRLWQGYCPDEIKIYPTQLLQTAELHNYWQRGEYQPYDTQTLVNLIADIKPGIPAYCRVNRIIRDIPSTHVVAGNRRTSLRQDVMAEMAARGTVCRCVRCREVRELQVQPTELRLEDLVYPAAGAEEHFLQFVTPDDRLAGYLRLSLPVREEAGLELKELRALMPELEGAALIREVHVYGQSIAVGSEQVGAAQHIGLGTTLLQQAEAVARAQGYRHLAVIAAVGTRLYYESRGFRREAFYMVKDIK